MSNVYLRQTGHNAVDFNAKHLCFFKAIERAGVEKSRGVMHPEYRSSHRLSDSFFIALSNLEVSSLS